MSFYVAAYDTEAVYPWWEKGERSRRENGFSYTPERIDEFLAGVRWSPKRTFSGKRRPLFFSWLNC
jgi:hypothetical protein